LSKSDQEVKILALFGRFPFRILAGVLTEIFRDVPQSLQTNSAIIIIIILLLLLLLLIIIIIIIICGRYSQ
jgi:flagellar biosynthesis protein FlhB